MARRKVLAFLAVIAGYLCFALFPAGAASSRDLIQCVPQHSWTVIGVDFPALRDNEVYADLENRGQIWKPDPDSPLAASLKSLHMDPKKDVRAFLYARYINSYGSKGRLEILEVTRAPGDELRKHESTAYMDTSIYRLDPDQDLRAAIIKPSVLAIGSLNEVKTAIDVLHDRLPGVIRNEQLGALLQKIPAGAAIWGIAAPLSRREAAKLGAKQETHPVLEAFENYYFYGVPTRKTADAHFFGQATSESQATFVSTFILGTVTFAKLRVDKEAADALDNIDVQRNGKTVHVSGVVTRKIVDAYLKGDLGVK